MVADGGAARLRVAPIDGPDGENVVELTVCIAEELGSVGRVRQRCDREVEAGEGAQDQ
jgi:hypothetical protein